MSIKNVVTNGVVQGSTYEKEIVGANKNSELNKDDFLQLLVAQMKSQDPMNPSTDTQYLAQLAQFSSLEQMQNLNQSNSNNQALSLVGRNVIVRTEASEGSEAKYINGYVDYVTIQNGKAYLSIEGNLYSINQIDSVLDEYFVQQTKRQAEEEAKNNSSTNTDNDNTDDTTGGVTDDGTDDTTGGVTDDETDDTGGV